MVTWMALSRTTLLNVSPALTTRSHPVVSPPSESSPLIRSVVWVLFEPMSAFVLVHLLAGEAPTRIELIGEALLVGGAVLALGRLGRMRHRRGEASPAGDATDAARAGRGETSSLRTG